MIILSVDVESTSLDIATCEIIELGMVVYDTTINQILSLHSDLFKVANWSEETESIHHIDKKSSDRGYESEFNPWMLVSHYQPQLIVAHNASYDKPLIVKRWPEFSKLPWLCTQRDLPHDRFVKNVSTSKLQYLAVDYGLEPGRRHRALFDSLLCCEIAARHDLENVLESSMEQRYRIEVCHEKTPRFNDQSFIIQKDYLKRAGFKWDGEKWIKEVVLESQVSKYVSLATAKPGWKVKQTPVDRGY